MEWELDYVGGEKEGKWSRYYENGKVKDEGTYVDGKGEGKWVWYDEEENITDEDIYKDDKWVAMCGGDE